jgi:tRNA(Arg) A34 adenosine deaminase TadA
MIVSCSACPMCSVPVTFGGGMTMQYGAPLPAGAK